MSYSGAKLAFKSIKMEIENLIQLAASLLNEKVLKLLFKHKTFFH